MEELVESINKKTSISLSRNKPVALVVAAAGFLGSHLIDKLLNQGIQVVGVDDLGVRNKRNLLEAVENRDFHLVIGSPDLLDIDLPRLDYLFIVSPKNWNLTKGLELFKRFKCRCLFVSSIDLYEKDADSEQSRLLKGMESRLARFASENNLNARVLRLGPVYGPRMDFQTKDPLIRLVSQALNGNLQKDVALEFSSRALYVADAVDLIVRTIFAGSTSQKIFDGVNTEPVQVLEIKQVLLDPVWYENRNFVPSVLPPWLTPNLDKTVKFLNWHPQNRLVANLRETLSYFKDNEITVPQLEDKETEVAEDKIKLDDDKRKDLELFKQGGKESEQKKKAKKGRVLPKFFPSLSKIYLLIIVALITYALIWPGVIIIGGILTFHYQLDAGLRSLERGEFDKSLSSIKQAYAGAEDVKSVLDTLEPIRKAGIFTETFETKDNLMKVALLSASSAESAVLGVQALLQSIKAVTGEATESPAKYLTTAQVELSAAGDNLSKTQAVLKDVKVSEVLSQKLAKYNNLVNKAQAISVLLPGLIAIDGNKSYLLLLQNNMELRPGGGFIGSFAKISFEGGKLKKLAVNDIYAIDGNLSTHVEPPKEIKEDLGQKDWFLRDSNWEPDFPTSARQAEWFYTKETGERVDGVIALDVSAMEVLLGAIGPLDLPDYNEKITAENLFERAITHAELSFFPGSQAKKSFMSALAGGAFNKIFFLPQNNWSGIISALGRSLDESHISIYLDDPKLFSYVLSQNWAHVLPRQSETNKNQDFLSVVEANLGANKVNYYLNKNYNLETIVGKEGEVKHRLRINYTNRSPSDTFPGGKYKNRMRIYLPFGSKMTRVLWGESDITKNTTGFVDYGRSGFSMLLELNPKEQKTLVLDYSVPVKLDFINNEATYRLDIIKQAGTLKDPLQWSISYPLSYQVIDSEAKMISPQEQTISTDLSINRSFEVKFRK